MKIRNIFSGNFSCIAIILFILLAGNQLVVKAQSAATIYPEGYFEVVSRYSQFKDSLPDYFFPYTLGGSQANEVELPMETMNARFNVIPLPVLISNLDDKSFEYFSQALFYVEKQEPKKETPEQPIREKHNYEFKEEKLLYELKNKENKTPEEEEQIKGYEEKLASIRAKKEAEKPKEEIKPTPQQNNKKPANNSKKPEQIAKKEPKGQLLVVDSLSLFAQLPARIKSQFEGKSNDEAVKWLYNQQILAGNVLYCQPETYIPMVEGLNTGEKIDAFNEFIFTTWKERYKVIWKNSDLEAHQNIANDNRESIRANAKESALKPLDFSRQFKAYTKLKAALNP